MVGVKSNFAGCAAAHIGNYCLIVVISPINVEDRQIGIEGVQVVFGGTNQQWGCKSPNSSIFNHQICVGKAFLQVIGYVNPPLLLCNGLTVEKNPYRVAVLWSTRRQKRHGTPNPSAKIGVILGWSRWGKSWLIVRCSE